MSFGNVHGSTTYKLPDEYLPEVGLVLSVWAVLVQVGHSWDQAQTIGHANARVTWEPFRDRSGRDSGSGSDSGQEWEWVRESVGSVGQGVRQLRMRARAMETRWGPWATGSRIVCWRKWSFSLPAVGMKLLLLISHNLNKKTSFNSAWSSLYH